MRRKSLIEKKPKDENKLVGPRPVIPHRKVDVESLPDAVELNDAEDGFVFRARVGERIIVTRPLDGTQETSVCTVKLIELDGVVSTWDETRGQWYLFTANGIAMHPEITMKLGIGVRYDTCREKT